MCLDHEDKAIKNKAKSHKDEKRGWFNDSPASLGFCCCCSLFQIFLSAFFDITFVQHYTNNLCFNKYELNWRVGTFFMKTVYTIRWLYRDYFAKSTFYPVFFKIFGIHYFRRYCKLYLREIKCGITFEIRLKFLLLL